MDGKLDPRVKGLICTALRSGEFPQGWVNVYAGEQYCVGGVVMNVFYRDTGRGYSYKRSGVKAEEIPALTKWLGRPGARFFYLTAYLNRQMTFPEIADVIERSW